MTVGIGALDSKGFIKVHPTFLALGLPKVFAFGDCADYDTVKTVPRIKDQLSTVVLNVGASLQGKALSDHKRGASFEASLKGPLLVAFGHGLPGA
jgi:NADH dehydrogenase FAD-containing subunit